MAGSSMKDIKLRIKSVESTMQITKAMQLVATSKLRRAKERMENSKPYAAISRAAVMQAAESCTDHSVPYVQPVKGKKMLMVLVAGDRGLAGGYNNNAFKAAAAEWEGRECAVMPVGRKALEFVQRRGREIITDSFIRVEGMSVSECFRMAKMLLDRFESGEADEIMLVYTTFNSMLSQEVTAERLLPIEKPEHTEKRLVSAVYDPSPEKVLKNTMPAFIAGRIYSAVCDSFASEVAARRTAMDSATKNAGEMISDLTLRYNRARQGAITQEITEIVAGAEH